MLRLGLFASGGGTNLQAILDACADGSLEATAAVVIGNNSGAKALERARQAKVPVVHLSSKTHPDPDALDGAILAALTKYDVQFVALCGYNKRLGNKTINAYRDRIVNVHPGLLPKYGGDGMFGERVHQSVIDNGEAESGATIHLVDEKYDHGAVVAESRVPVLPDDTVESLAARILVQEHLLYVDTLRLIAKGIASRN